MKISKFVEKNNTSHDTIRHYMKLGLINPSKNGGQYDFDENCQINFDNIIKLKDMGFSLSEIKTILLFDKFGRLTQYSEISEYRSLYLDKLADIDKEILRLNHAKNNIENYISTLKQPKQFNHQFGIPLKDIGLLHCSTCQKPLDITDGVIEENSLISGELKCGCGESYSIINGILICCNTPNNKEILSGTEFVGNYIKHTSDDYLNNISRALEFFNSIVGHINFENKTIIEAGTGWGVFIRYIYDKLPSSITYVAVDKSYEQLLLLKETLSQVPIKKNILFICADFNSLPLKHQSFDILVDASGSTSYNFHTDKWLLNTLKPYLKPDYDLLAGYMLFSKFKLTSDIPSHLRKYYDMNFLENHLKENNIEILRSALYDQVDVGGPYDSYFGDGEVVFSRCIYGKHMEEK